VAGRRRGYTIEYDRDAEQDLLALEARDRGLVLDGIEEQLRHQPERETRNRGRTRPNPYGAWRLRVPPYRVYYDVNGDARTVRVNAVFYKPRETAYRRGKEVDLDE
jgi:mRNA-degrading endonuclease RelE of RelBE toxin-antitoxin system